MKTSHRLLVFSIFIGASAAHIWAIPGSRVRDLEKVGGTLWVMIDGNAVAYNTATAVYDTYHYEDFCKVSPNAYSQDNAFFTSASAHAENDVWFGSNGCGIGHFDGADMSWIDIDAIYCDIVKPDASGDPWVGAGFDGLIRHDGESWVKIGISTVSSNPHYTAIEFDANGLAWATMSAGMGAGFCYCDGVTCVGVQADAPSWYQDTRDSFTSLAIGNNGDKWLSHYHDAKICHYKNDGSYEIIGLPQLENKNISPNDIQIGPDSRVWVAYGQALFTIDCDHNIEKTEISLPDETDYITCFIHDGNITWIGTAKSGLFRWLDNTLERVEGTAGVELITPVIDSEPKPDPAIYDIMGRRVEFTIPGSAYISAGRKFVAR